MGPSDASGAPNNGSSECSRQPEQATSSGTDSHEFTHTDSCGHEATPKSPQLAAKRRREEGKVGCPHYRRRCKLVAPCCEWVTWCHHCHNEAKQGKEQDPKKYHELEREQVREVVCALCDTRQPLATSCRSCQVCFGKWACVKCSMFDDDVSKRQFHCDKCGICRVGGRENFFHCDVCGSCYSNSLNGGRHTCVVNSMKSNCPVCLEYLFDSTRGCSVLKCGHTVHEECLQGLRNSQRVAMTCPLCCKSLHDHSEVWEAMDREVSRTPMPAEYAGWMADILCNDCLNRSTVPFHVVGLRCASCHSYNTRRIASYDSRQTST